ncbi:ORF075 [Staphylococcus phage 85]|nr:ORF075 [Staphylococcus phage 85]
MMPIIQIILSHIIQRSENQVCQTDCIRTRGVMKLLCTNLLKIITSFTDRKGGRHG